MNPLTIIRTATTAAGLLAVATGPAFAQQIQGVYVEELAAWDSMMQNFMTNNNITAGVLAVAKTDGTIVYQRGFNIPENTPMRVASVEKPITAAAVRKIASDGLIDPNDFVFDLGQPGGGLLNITPYDGLGDSRYADITVTHLIAHRGGFDSAVNEPQFDSINICNDLRVVDPSVTDPAGRENTVRWMLSQPLDYDPGAINACTRDGDPNQLCYSNFGYMLLGLIIEEVTGQPNYIYIRNNILTPDMWVPATEIKYGRTFANDQNPREPYYDDGGSLLTPNVFNPGGPYVEWPYGGWEHEVFRGHGNLVMSAAPLLVFMENYWVQNGGPSGMPLNGANGGGTHTGAVLGTSTVMMQRTDGVNIVVLFNRQGEVPDGSGGTWDFGLAMAVLVSNWITNLFNSGGSLPDFAVDGFWVDFGATGSNEVGGYNEPFTSMSSALSATTHGTKLRFQSGSTSWTGVLTEKMRLDAPYGTVRIGGP